MPTLVPQWFARSDYSIGSNAAPMNLWTTLRQGFIALTKGDPDGAELLLASLKTRQPLPTPVSHLMSLVRCAQGRVPEAEAYLREALTTDPEDLDCWFSLGMLYISTRDFHAAARCFQEVVSRSPAYPGVRVQLVRALDSAGEVDTAEAQADDLVRSDPSAKNWTVLGGILRKQRKMEKAIAAFDHALDLAPRDYNVRFERAVTLNKAGLCKEAIAEYAELYAGGLVTPMLFRSWAIALFEVGCVEESMGKLIEGVALHPGDVEIQSSLARMRWLAGDDRAYLRDFLSAVREHPDNLSLRIGCADLLRKGDLKVECATLLNDGLLRKPGDPSLLSAIGVVKSELGDLGAAELALKQALSYRPHDRVIRESLATVLMRAGKAQEALSHIDLALLARPLDQAWLAHRATAARMLGEPVFEELYDFARMVRSYELPPPAGFTSTAEFNEALVVKLSEMHRLNVQPIDQSLVNGSQTVKSLLESSDPLILGFLDSVGRAIEQYIAEMPNLPGHPFWGRKPLSGRSRLKGCWSVRLRCGGYHVNHIHPEGWISSAYYAVVPPDSAGSEDRQGWIQFGEPRWPTPEAQAAYFVEPQPGRLVLFPSYMWHGTVPFKSGPERMTIAFDAVPA